MSSTFGILRFREQYIERIWGGQRLRTLYGKPIALDRSIGEAWLISDHPSAVSVVSEGPHVGRTIHDLIEEDAEALLGSRSKLTPQGRFPLLLKLLDSTEVLSVQVHPDDATAAALGESDVGKTEMWHILHADPEAELFCGLRPGTTPEQMRSAIETGTLENHLARFNVKQGDSVLVPAGTVHAIGQGIVLAEIQQNSDLTYRLYDWNRVDAAGNSRELHVEKGIRAAHFSDDTMVNKTTPLEGCAKSGSLAICEYFSAERVEIEESEERVFTTNNLFYIALSICSSVVVSCGTDSVALGTAQSCLVPACAKKFTISGPGTVLLYSA